MEIDLSGLHKRILDPRRKVRRWSMLQISKYWKTKPKVDKKRMNIVPYNFATSADILSSNVYLETRKWIILLFIINKFYSA